MVSPPSHRPMVAACLALGLLAPAGCAVVPKSRLDDCTKLAQSLRSENAQLKDTALGLKGENADLAQRALDDSRKLTALEDANERLETSVQAYIDEREALNDAFQRFKRQAQATSAPPSSALISRLRSFAGGRDGTTFDPASGVLAVEADRLFLPGTDRVRPEAARWLDDCAAILAEPEARSRPLLVAGLADGPDADPSVRRAGAGAAASPGPEASRPAVAGDLSLARAVRVRDLLAERAGRDPSRIGVAGLGAARDEHRGPGPDARARPRAPGGRIEIDLAPLGGRPAL